MSRDFEGSARKAAGIPAIIHRQLFVHPPPLREGTTLTGRIAILTGGNSGVGYEACRQLLRLRSARLIITVRSQSKGDEALSKPRREFSDALVSAWLLDMESYESITTFTQRCNTLLRIDVVILNAGLQKNIFELNKHTQHETSVQVNYLSTALLAILLLPVLNAKKVSGAPAPLLSILTSDTAYWAKINTTGPILPRFD